MYTTSGARRGESSGSLGLCAITLGSEDPLAAFCFALGAAPVFFEGDAACPARTALGKVVAPAFAPVLREGGGDGAPFARALGLASITRSGAATAVGVKLDP